MHTLLSAGYNLRKKSYILISSVEVEVDRVGGAYGGKASRSSQVACACALVAHKLQRHASLAMPLTDNMNAIGKRQACFVEYEVISFSIITPLTLKLRDLLEISMLKYLVVHFTTWF